MEYATPRVQWFLFLIQGVTLFINMEGWIKLYRKFSDWEWFNISEMVHLFIYLLLNANHEDGEWRGVNIQRGQILTGLKILNERTKISNQTLRTCLKRLEKTKEINIKVTNKYSIITICNYESYQDGQQATNNQPNKELTNNKQATNKQLTTNNNNKEEKELKKEKNIIPPTFEMVKKYCDERNNGIDPQYFIDSNSLRGWVYGKNRIKIVDWQACIRTWEQYQKKEQPKLMMP
jgi:hypothetical protein